MRLISKTDLQCRERFCNILDPRLLKKPKIEEKEMMTIVHYVVFRKTWSWLAKHVTSGMTDNDVFRHFRNFKERKKVAFSDIVRGEWGDRVTASDQPDQGGTRDCAETAPDDPL